MKWGLPTLILGVIFACGSNGMYAQNDTTSKFIYIGCAAEFEVYEGFAEGWGIQLIHGCYGDVLAQVTKELEQFGIRLAVASNESELADAVLFIYAPLDIHGRPLASLENLTPSYLELSPLLAAHATQEIVVYADSMPNREAIAALTAGLIVYSLGNCDDAIPYFNDVLASSIVENTFMSGSGGFNPPITDYLTFYRGNCALMSEDYDLAISEYNSFSDEALFYGTIAAPTNLAWTYLQIGRHEQAFHVMDQMLEAVSSGLNNYPRKQVEAHVSRAQLYALAFRYDEALADMDAAIELDPTNPELYVLRGQITLYLYEWDRALADYNRAIELDPDYADAYYYRGVLFYTQGYREDARADFRRYLDLAPDGDHAADAAQYIADIERELEALN
jgi:tetratricopeptide (TPR) repeat protein